MEITMQQPKFGAQARHYGGVLPAIANADQGSPLKGWFEGEGVWVRLKMVVFRLFGRIVGPNSYSYRGR